MADKIKIMIPRKYWINKKYSNPYSELFAHYYLIKHPNQDEYPDYIAKIPSSYVILFNEKPSEIEASINYDFHFEKWHKEADKRYPKIKITIEELARIYPSEEGEKYCFLSFNIYEKNEDKIKIIDNKIDLFLIDDKEEWLSHPLNLNEKKKAHAKGNRVIRIFNKKDNSYLQYLDLKNQHQNYINDLNQINSLQIATSQYFDEMIFKSKNKTTQKLAEACKTNAEDNLNLIANSMLRLQDEKLEIEKNLFAVIYGANFDEIKGKDCWFDFEDDERSFRGTITALEYPLIVVKNNYTQKTSKTFYERVKLI